MGGKQPTLGDHKSGQSNEPLSAPAHALSFQQVIEETKCNPDDGLTTAEAKSRLEKFGSNDLGDDGGVQPAKILLRQVANSMTLVSPMIVRLVASKSNMSRSLLQQWLSVLPSNPGLKVV
jgi:Na+-exporting ATPase